MKIGVVNASGSGSRTMGVALLYYVSRAHMQRKLELPPRLHEQAFVSILSTASKLATRIKLLVARLLHN